MRLVKDPSWQKKGLSLLWSPSALSYLVKPKEVLSVRQLFQLQDHWPNNLPAVNGNALVIAGLEGCLDMLNPDEAYLWLEKDLISCIFSFQDEYEGQAALIFWLPSGNKRIKMTPATDAYYWQCGGKYGQETIPIGQALWAGSASDIGRILDPNSPNLDPDGQAWIGLYHPRIS